MATCYRESRSIDYAQHQSTTTARRNEAARNEWTGNVVQVQVNVAAQVSYKRCHATAHDDADDGSYERNVCYDWSPIMRRCTSVNHLCSLTKSFYRAILCTARSMSRDICLSVRPFICQTIVSMCRDSCRTGLCDGCANIARFGSD